MRPQAVGIACENLSCDNYGKIYSSKRKVNMRLSLNEMADAAYKNSAAKGFWDEHKTGALHPETISSKLALIHSEVSEALEDARGGAMKTRFLSETGREGKPVGFPTELADIIIRVGDLAARLGIDLEDEVTTKMVYNATRPRMHGRSI
jgi:NTP pyrophosphatase (non-canonical NTP hydrolase)